jgi:uncharacterized protein involved in exopolysaccharide biosynthesis
VIAVSFKHPDPEVAQSVVRQTIDLYLKAHVEVHRSAGMVGEFLAQETDQLRSRLAQTEDELRKARAKAGVASVEDAKKAFMDQITGLRQQVFAAQAERAAKEAVLKELTERVRNRVRASEPNTPQTQDIATAEPTEQTLPPGVLDELRTVMTQLESMRRRQQELLLTFTPEHPRVQAITSQVTELETRKSAIIAAHPILTQTAVAKTATPVNNARAVSLERLESLESEAAQLSALDARMKTLNAQIEILRNEAIALDQLEGNIQQLLRKKELEEANYRRYAASLEQSRINEALGSGKVSNISLIQTPSPAFIDPNKTLKIAGGIVAGGIGLGLAWAFLIELLLDRSVRRPHRSRTQCSRPPVPVDSQTARPKAQAGQGQQGARPKPPGGKGPRSGGQRCQRRLRRRRPRPVS